MRKIFKSIIVIVMALVMAISSLVVVAAEVTETAEDGMNTITIMTDDGTKAYQLVWKYKSSGGHMYKRRWNMTLGIWYDADWILVY